MSHPPDDLILRGAAEMARAIRAREVSARDLLDLHLERIREINPVLNAIVRVDEDEARQRAAAADAALARGEVWGALHGVPFSAKDCLETAGLVTTAGDPQLRDHLPDQDAPVVARVRAAGGVLLGKTNLPPLAGDYLTDNPLFGRTNNPWDVTRTPGGSTGGGAAAVAAGLSPLELGSDLGGSLRLPAHYCGVYSLKPTEGRVPLTGHIPNPVSAARPGRHMWVIGPLARSLADLELALSLLGGPDGIDWGVPPVPFLPAEPIPMNRLRIAWWTDFDAPLGAELAGCVQRLADDLERAGCRVSQTAPPGFNFQAADECWGELEECEYAAGLTAEQEQAGKADLDRRLARDPTRLAETPSLRGEVRRYQASARDYLDTLARRDAFITRLEDFLQDWDAWLCPVSATPAFLHQKSGKPIAVDGRLARYPVAVGAHLRPFSLTGSPVVTIPAGLTAGGLPMGVQLVGRRWGEARLLAAARRVDQLAGGFRRPPELSVAQGRPAGARPELPGSEEA